MLKKRKKSISIRWTHEKDTDQSSSSSEFYAKNKNEK